MGRRALILAAFALASTAPGPAVAQERIEVQLPDCRPPHIDTALLREVLAIELDDAAGESIVVAVSESLCDPTRESVEVWIRDAASERGARDHIAISAEVDPASRARAIALAIAERARLALGTRTLDAAGSVTTTPPQSEPSIPESLSVAPTMVQGEPSRARETLADPSAADTAPSPSARLDPALALSLLGRVAPVLPSWALGLRAEVRAHLDPTWSLRGGVLATWSRASPREGDVDAAVLALTGGVGLALLRDPGLEILLEAQAEAGLLVAAGSPVDGASRTSEHPWAALGLALDSALQVSPELALTAALSASGVLAGTRVWSTSGAQIDLSLFVIDLALGARIALR